jgi:hypothetical protein
MFRKPVKTAAAMLAAMLLLCACAGQPAPGRDAELERETGALRARVERLEREAETSRAKLAADVAAMREDMRALRATLEEASRSLGALSGREGVQEGQARPGQAGKSPRQALRDSLRSMLDVSREALERLNLELDRQLGQPSKPEAPER